MNFYLISNSFKSFYLFRREIIHELNKKYNVILVANNDEYFPYFSKKYKCISLNNYFNSRNIIKNFLLILKIILIFFKKKPDIVQTYTIHPNLLCIPLAKLFLSKTCSMVTGMGAISVAKNLLMIRIIDICYKFSFYFSDYIIFVNKDNEKYFKNKLNINKKSIRIYGAGVSRKKNLKSNKFLSNKHNLQKTFNILFVGRLIKEKGILDALKIFKLINIPNKRLIFVGDFDNSSFSKALDKKIFKYPGVTVTGHLKNTDEVYNFANIFLLPSITEGMPTSLMESIMHNVPTISYRIPGANDIIVNDLNGIKLKTNDINGVVNKIHQIYFSKEYKNLLINNSKKLKIKINRENVIKKVLNLYDKFK